MNTETPSSNPVSPVSAAFEAKVEPGKDQTISEALADKMEVVGKRAVTLDKFSFELPQDLVRVRVKITFQENQQPLIPAEFDYRPQQDALSTQLWQQQEAVFMGKPELAVVGRHREGLVDTGEPIFESNYPARLAFLVKGLAANSIHLASVFVQIKKKENMNRQGRQPVFKKLHVLNMDFKPRADVPEFEPKTTAGRRALMNMTFGYIKIWRNPDKSITINVGGIQPVETKPRYALVVRHGWLTTKMLNPSEVEEDKE